MFLSSLCAGTMTANFRLREDGGSAGNAADSNVSSRRYAVQNKAGKASRPRMIWRARGIQKERARGSGLGDSKLDPILDSKWQGGSASLKLQPPQCRRG